MTTKAVDINKVAQIAQVRFPLQWEICVQQAYIELLQEESDSEESDD